MLPNSANMKIHPNPTIGNLFISTIENPRWPPFFNKNQNKTVTQLHLVDLSLQACLQPRSTILHRKENKHQILHTQIISQYFLWVLKKYAALAESAATFMASQGGGRTPLFGLCGYVPLDSVWFFGLAALIRVYNFGIM